MRVAERKAFSKMDVQKSQLQAEIEDNVIHTGLSEQFKNVLLLFCFYQM